MEKTCENCEWNSDQNDDGDGFCEEKEQWVRWYESCPHWKERKN